ncbi:MAG: ABC transporter permease [Firmicutes bacterium]|nr:ABC transporter permease [Bacillota bacterium]MCL5040028.1 ABC transporter permease [Bacillota bacterium]
MRGLYAVMWRELLVLRKRLWKTLAAGSISPVLYLTAFGWGIGRNVTMGSGNYLHFIIPGIIALTVMNNSFSGVATPLNISRHYSKTFEEYLIAPVSNLCLALGKAAGGILRGLTASAVVLVVSLLFKVHLHLNLWFFITLFVSSFAFASMGVLAGMVIRSHEDQSNFNTFVLLPMSFLSGTFFHLDLLPTPLASFIKLLPLTHVAIALRSIATDQVTPYASLGVITLFALIFFLAAVFSINRYREI